MERIKNIVAMIRQFGVGFVGLLTVDSSGQKSFS
jgi:hypothetical protein